MIEVDRVADGVAQLESWLDRAEAHVRDHPIFYLFGGSCELRRRIVEVRQLIDQGRRILREAE